MQPLDVRRGRSAYGPRFRELTPGRWTQRLCGPLARAHDLSRDRCRERLRLRRRRTEFVLQGVHDTVDVLRQWAQRAAAKISWMKAGSRAAAGGLPIAEMKRWYLAGDSNQTIGQRVSLHQGTVRRVLIEAGVTMRTRPEQVALNDARTGVRVPSRDELVAGYIEEGLTSAELAVRFGISETRIQSMLVRHGVERRRGGIRAARAEAERAARRPPQLIEEIVSLYGSGLSRKATAARGRRAPGGRRRRVATRRGRVPGPAKAPTVERMGGPLRGRRRDHRRDRRDLCCVARGGAASPQARWHRAATGNGSDAAAERRRRRRVLRRRTTVDRRHRETARSVAPASASRGRPVGGAADSVRPVNTGPQTVRPAIRRRRHDR